MKTLIAVLALIGLIAAALTSSRLAEGSGCTNWRCQRADHAAADDRRHRLHHQRLLAAAV